MKVYISGLRYETLDRIKKIQEGKLEMPKFLDEKAVNSIPIENVYVLDTYFKLRKRKKDDRIKQLCSFHDFLLDSGAFSFLNKSHSKQKVNFDEYAEQYAYFIKKYNVEKFFELDIDSIVGYDKVKEYRSKIERITGKYVIPVWHRSRGIDEYKKLCSDYSYIAIGGIAIKEIKKKEFPMFIPLIKIAHNSNCKVHGLGFTDFKNMRKYHFDTTDSSSWVYPKKYGFLPKFNSGGKIEYIHSERKLKYLDDTYLHSFVEWMKFQQWAKRL